MWPNVSMSAGAVRTDLPGDRATRSGDAPLDRPLAAHERVQAIARSSDRSDLSEALIAVMVWQPCTPPPHASGSTIAIRSSGVGSDRACRSRVCRCSGRAPASTSAPSADLDVLVFEADDGGLQRAVELRGKATSPRSRSSRAENERVLYDAVDAGVSAIHLRAAVHPDVLASSVRAAAERSTTLPSDLIPKLLHRARHVGQPRSSALHPREVAVLAQALAGRRHPVHRGRPLLLGAHGQEHRPRRAHEAELPQPGARGGATAHAAGDHLTWSRPGPPAGRCLATWCCNEPRSASASTPASRLVRSPDS